jgi:hypothetical protein
MQKMNKLALKMTSHESRSIILLSEHDFCNYYSTSKLFEALFILLITALVRTGNHQNVYFQIT